MPNFRIIKAVSLLLPVLLLSPMSAALAQESADSLVSIVRQEAVKISNVDDWDFGTWAVHDVSKAAERLRDNTCVHSTTGSYALTINSQNGTNRLRLMSNSGERIRYNIVVRYRDGTTLARERVIQTGTTINGMTGSSTVDCSSGPNWNLRFIPIINKRQFNLASPGIYQDVVTLLVTPE